MKENKQHERKYNITLTESDIDTLLTCLRPDNDEYSTQAHDIHNKLNALKLGARKPATTVYFINVYETEQQYGGPEEGGWYYHTMNCIASVGHVCGGDTDNMDLPFLSYHVLAELEGFFDVNKIPDITAIQHSLETNNTISYYELDKYGNGIILKVEDEATKSHDISQQHYE